MSDTNLKALAAQIVAAYAGNNHLSSTDVADVIHSVYNVLARIDGAPVAAAVAPQAPAVSIKKSVTPDAIICLECGKHFKMLKRHLGADHNLTIDEYRAKWHLSGDYPVVAPNYAATRSSLAKAAGLGQKRVGGAPAKARKKLDLPA